MATRSTNIFNTASAYNKIARHFARTRQNLWPELIQFKPLIKSGQYILDWGCGNGRLLALFNGKKINYFGVDISGTLLKIARHYARQTGGEGVAKFFNTLKIQKNFPAEFFDMVFMVASFFHLPNVKTRRVLLAKTYRELKPGGRLILTVWNLSSAWARKKRYEWKVLKKNDFLIPWKSPDGKLMAERYYHNFTKRELKKLLVEAGFAVKRLEFMGTAKSTDSKGGRNLVAVALKK